MLIAHIKKYNLSVNKKFMINLTTSKWKININISITIKKKLNIIKYHKNSNLILMKYFQKFVISNQNMLSINKSIKIYNKI